MLILSPADYRTMPWKNGGGTTTELYAEPAPPELQGADFLWRVSIADVSSNGPFSRFEGYDRHIMCIDGRGMLLEGIPGGPGDVTVPYRPFTFSGDWAVFASLVSGAVRDFNLIAHRRTLRSSLTCSTLSEDLEIGGDATQFIHVLDGELNANGSKLCASHSILLRPGERLTLEKASARPPCLACCSMTETTR